MAGEPDPEVIRRQMEAQRASLAEKLETLENKIVRTVDEAREAVAETVQTVKDSVQSSVETVKDTVHSSVETVKETFDVPLQVQRHPWAMFGGSVAVGFAAGWLLNRALRASRGPRRDWAAPAAYAPAQSYVSAPRGGHDVLREQARSASIFADAAPASAPTAPPAPAAPQAPRGPSWLDELAKTFAPEVQKLKGLAIGAAMSVARDLLSQSLPEQLRPHLDELVNNVTAKLGGEQVPGHLLDDLVPRWRHNGAQHLAPELEPQP